jgi:hypothetical protein
MAPTSASLEASEALSAKGATHPRVSLADMNDAIAGENYINAGAAAEAAGQRQRSDAPHDPVLPHDEQRVRGGRQVGPGQPGELRSPAKTPSGSSGR